MGIFFSKKWKDLWDKDDVQLLTPAENLRVIQQAQSKANNYLIDGIKDIGFDGKGNYKTISKGLNKWEKRITTSPNTSCSFFRIYDKCKFIRYGKY